MKNATAQGTVGKGLKCSELFYSQLNFNNYTTEGDLLAGGNQETDRDAEEVIAVSKCVSTSASHNLYMLSPTGVFSNVMRSVPHPPILLLLLLLLPLAAKPTLLLIPSYDDGAPCFSLLRFPFTCYRTSSAPHSLCLRNLFAFSLIKTILVIITFQLNQRATVKPIREGGRRRLCERQQCLVYSNRISSLIFARTCYQ